MKTVSIVIPVYYNAESIPLLFIALQKTEQVLVERGYNLELIFVDDGSGDQSFEELLKVKLARPATKLIRLTRNFGVIAAVKTAYKFVTGDCFVPVAADLQDPLELIYEMLTHWEQGYKFILANRRKRSDSPESQLFARIYYWLLRVLVVPDYPEGGYDMALMDKVFLPYMVNSSKNINTHLFAYSLGFKPLVLPYDRPPRPHGKSRWSFRKRMKFFIDSLLGFSVFPIRIISATGLFVSLFSFAYGLSVTLSALFGGREVPGFTTLAALITFLLGLIIIMLGIIGEYIWRIFDELNKRPEAVIDEVY